MGEPESNLPAVVDSALPLTVQDVRAQVNMIQEIMKGVMHENEHYGLIPGCGKKQVLFKSGAEKLALTFRLAPTYKIERLDLPNGHREYQVICSLSSSRTGVFMGEGVGCCSSMESKYRWRTAQRKCPECGEEAIIKGREEFGGGWLCFHKKGGCGAKWKDGDPSIEKQPRGRVENQDIADVFNTVLKMGKKRAFVDGILVATSASDLFTQDLEENHIPEPPQKPTKEPPQQPPAPEQSAAARLADLRRSVLAQAHSAGCTEEGMLEHVGKKKGEPWTEEDWLHLKDWLDDYEQRQKDNPDDDPSIPF